jgi:hypothetical protein
MGVFAIESELSLETRVTPDCQTDSDPSLPSPPKRNIRVGSIESRAVFSAQSHEGKTMAGTNRCWWWLVVAASLLPNIAGFSVSTWGGSRLALLAPRTSHALLVRMEVSEDDALDQLVRQEVEAAFAGLEESLSSGDDDAAIALIQSQGKNILGNVLAKLEEEGTLLSSTLSSQIEELASTRQVELLKKYNAQLDEIEQSMTTERVNIRTEMAQLESLNRDLADLRSGGGGSGFSRDKIVSGVALLVGLTGVGAALNEALRLALGAGGDMTTLGLNAVLGAAGVFAHLQRKG